MPLSYHPRPALRIPTSPERHSGPDIGRCAAWYHGRDDGSLRKEAGQSASFRRPHTAERRDCRARGIQQPDKPSGATARQAVTEPKIQRQTEREPEVPRRSLDAQARMAAMMDRYEKKSGESRQASVDRTQRSDANTGRAATQQPDKHGGATARQAVTELKIQRQTEREPEVPRRSLDAQARMAAVMDRYEKKSANAASFRRPHTAQRREYRARGNSTAR